MQKYEPDPVMRTGLDRDYPLDWVEFRQINHAVILIPPVGVVWRESAGVELERSLHVAVNPWIRQSDGMVIYNENMPLVCRGPMMRTDETWYGLMAYYPKGYDLIPARPMPQRPICLKCLLWLDRARFHVPHCGAFVAQPGHLQERTIPMATFRGVHEGANIMAILPREHVSPGTADESGMADVDPLIDAAVDDDAEDAPPSPAQGESDDE